MTEGMCVYDQCKHDDLLHINGSCYAITEPDKTGVEKFCKCDSLHGGNQRLYQDLITKGLGMQIHDNDMFVTKRCGEDRVMDGVTTHLGCGQDVLLRIDQNLCMNCNPEPDRVLDESPDYIIFRPISQTELQKML